MLILHRKIGYRNTIINLIDENFEQVIESLLNY